MYRVRQLTVAVSARRSPAGAAPSHGTRSPCVPPCRSLQSLLDNGDIVGVTGFMKRTDKGELSVAATQVQMLSKSLLPLPDKWKGLADVELRYRQR